MFKGLLRNVELASTQRDLERYVLSLDGASADEVAQIVIAAHHVRLAVEAGGMEPADLLAPFTVAPGRIEHVHAALLRLLRAASKERQEFTEAGATLWVHSLAGVRHPELRVQGRKLWGTLSRGFRAARLLAAHSDSVQSGRLRDEVDAIPTGLEPRDERGEEFMPGTPGYMIVARFEAMRVAAAARAHETAAAAEQAKEFAAAIERDRAAQSPERAAGPNTPANDAVSNWNPTIGRGR